MKYLLSDDKQWGGGPMNSYLLLWCALCVLLAGCERRELENEYYETAKIPISIIWENAELAPYAASIWLFPTDAKSNNGVPIEYRMADPSYKEIDVPIGTYSVLVFNEYTDGFDNIRFRGTNRYDSFEAYTISDTKYAKGTKEGDQQVLLEPDELAAFRSDTFTVTREMVTRTRSKTKQKTKATMSMQELEELDEAINSLTNIRPDRLTQLVMVKAHVENLSSVSSATGLLRGMSSSVMMASGEVKTPLIIQSHTFNKITWDDTQKKHGIIQSQSRTFGRLGEDKDPDAMELNFVLRDGSNNEPLSFDLDGKIDVEVAVETKLHVDLGNISSLPVVEGGDGGFGVGVGGWEENIDVPLN